DVADAGLPEHALEVAHRVQAHALVALALEALLQHRVELLHALALVALQAGEDLGGDGVLRLDVALADLVDGELFDTGHGCGFGRCGRLGTARMAVRGSNRFYIKAAPDRGPRRARSGRERPGTGLSFAPGKERPAAGFD